MDNITIEKAPGYRCGEEFFCSLREAQRFALQNLVPEDTENGKFEREDFANVIIDNAQTVLAILTGTKPRKPRADRGKSHRKPQPPAEVKDSPEPGALPGVKVEASTKYRGK